MLRALPLRAPEEPGEQRVDEVGTPDRAVQQAAAAEERGPFDVAVPDDVRLVVQRVAGGVEDLDLEGADRDDSPPCTASRSTSTRSSADNRYGTRCRAARNGAPET